MNHFAVELEAEDKVTRHTVNKSKSLKKKVSMHCIQKWRDMNHFAVELEAEDKVTGHTDNKTKPLKRKVSREAEPRKTCE